MSKINKAIWFTLGMICLGIAYIGVVVPGIPWSTPTLGAVYCFAKSSTRWHNYLVNHKLFGPFITSWSEKRVYPTKVKWIMAISMDASLLVIWFTTHNWKLVLGVGIAMLMCAIFAWRYPGSHEEYQRRKDAGEKIGWLK